MQSSELTAQQRRTAPFWSRIFAWDGWRSDVLPLVGYSLLTLVMTHPMIFHLKDGIAIRDVDGWMKLWDDWWFVQVLHGQNWLFTPYMFHPQGLTLRFHSINWIYALLSWLFSLLIGPIGGHNLVMIVVTIFCGYFAYRLGMYLFNSSQLAWVCGAIFALFPFRKITGGTWPDLSMLVWLPLMILLILKVIETKKAGYAIAAGAALALSIWSSYYIFAVTIVAVSGLYLYLVLEDQRWRDPIFWRQAAIFGITGLILMLPRLIPILINPSELGQAMSQHSDPSTFQIDPISMFLPSKWNGFFYPFLKNLPILSILGNGAHSYYIGIAAAILIIASIWSAYRRKLTIWYILFAVFFFLSMGPILRLNRHIYPNVWLPARLVYWLPFIRGVRPHVFNLGLALPTAVLAAAGAQTILQRVTRENLRMGAVFALTGIICVDYWTGRAPIQDVTISPFFHQIGADQSDFAVIELPMGRLESKQYMYYQTIYQHPMVEGWTGRPLPGMKDYIFSNKLLNAWNRNNPLDCTQVDYAASLQALEKDGFRYIIVHKDKTGQVWDTMPAYFASDPYYADQYLFAYRISDLLANPTPCDAPSTR